MCGSIVYVESPPPLSQKRNILPKNLLLVKSKRQMSRSPIRCARGLFIFSTPFDPHHRPTHPRSRSFIAPSFARCGTCFSEKQPPLPPGPCSLAHLRSWFSLLCTLGAFAQNQRGGGRGEGCSPEKEERKGWGDRRQSVHGTRKEEETTFCTHSLFPFFPIGILDRECLEFQTRVGESPSKALHGI